MALNLRMGAVFAKSRVPSYQLCVPITTYIIFLPKLRRKMECYTKVGQKSGVNEYYKMHDKIGNVLHSIGGKLV